jgi:hypothetical protein
MKEIEQVAGVQVASNELQVCEKIPQALNHQQG